LTARTPSGNSRSALDPFFVAVGQEVRARLLNAKQAGIIASKLLGIPGLIFKVIPGASPKEIISIEYKEKKYMME
jgi:hypothetical protein